jgi:hypothetical protein
VKARNVDPSKAVHIMGIVAGGFVLAKFAPSTLETIPASYSVRPTLPAVQKDRSTTGSSPGRRGGRRGRGRFTHSKQNLVFKTPV